MTKTTALLACAMVLPLAKHVAAEPVIDETQSPSDISPDMAPTPDPGVIDASPGSFSDVTVTNGASSLHVVPNGNTIWDYDALTTNNTSAATLRRGRTAPASRLKGRRRVTTTSGRGGIGHPPGTDA